ncbi:small integral membrane protein 20 [Homalodisca vitripennis]|uniref:small integral membrane protein 20 n=1 Tax=Homalodisca vitripennis TaxID=197043 RepID=UPI001EEAE4EC|nr:small integral membrane protein 20 [Homalodisca vitripennis]
MRHQRKLVGWRYGVFIGSCVAFLGLAVYPVIISPMINPDYYKQVQAIGRKDIKQENVQPGKRYY